MTKNELLSIGCREITWNLGAFYEYYLPITGDGREILDSRLAVRFGEHQDIDFTTYLILPHTIVALNHVRTIEQFKAFYTLMTGSVPTEKSEAN